MKQLDLWRKLALGEMHGILKPLGFKKTATNFRRCQNGVWMVFNLQSSSWNYNDQPMVVYGNLGLHYVIEGGWTNHGKNGPCVTDCHWRARVRGNHGQSFEFDSDEGAILAGQTIATDGLAILEAVLEKYLTPESMWEAYAENSITDRKVWPWSQCQRGWLARDLNVELKMI